MRAARVALLLGGSGLVLGLAEALARGLGGRGALAVAGLGSVLGITAALGLALVGLALRAGGRPEPATGAARIGVTAALSAAFVCFCHQLARFLILRYREPRLMALVLGVLGAGFAAAGVLAGVPLARALRARTARRARREPPRRALRAAAIAGLAAQVALASLALHDASDPRRVSLLRQAALGRLALRVARSATDFDADGAGLVPAPRDCAPLDAAVRPGARDRPGNGVDEDCSGEDASADARGKKNPGQRP
jgi:hypothetical protein